jgi:hypothetical protein
MNLSRLIAIAAVAVSSLASAIPVITEVAVTPGPTTGGNRVYIEGLGLNTVTSVTFGATAVTPDLVTSNYIICNAPLGQGANISVQAFGGGTSNVVSTFSYAPPVVANLSASSSPTSGGSVLTITGANFGFNRTVTIGGAFATPTGLNNHTQLQVLIPPGQGANQPIVINVSGQTNAASPAAQLNYNAPSINNVISNGFTTAGGTATLTGSNFGLTPQVLVNGIPTSTSGGTTHSSITFNGSPPAKAPTYPFK